MCSSIYPLHECGLGSVKESKRCSYIEFPNHPQLGRRKECGALLMQSVKTLPGKIMLRPYLVYCYKSLINSLQEFLIRPGFYEICEDWRKRTSYAVFTMMCIMEKYGKTVKTSMEKHFYHYLIISHCT